jgi:hypothetical protein
MPRMSELDFRRMRDQSAHADHIWKEKGLTTAQPGKYGETSLFTHMDAYRGDQWKTIGLLAGLADESHLVVNAVFSTLNTLQAQLLARNPAVRVKPRSRSQGPKRAMSAQAFQTLLNYLVQEAKLARAWNAAMRDAFYRVGFVRVGYTPPDETIAKGKIISRGPSALDIPWMRRVAPWDIRIDPLAESWHADGDARWCEFIGVATMEELKANPAITVPRDLQSTISKDKRERDQRRLGGSDPYMHEAANLVEVRTRYDAVERKWFQWSPGSEKLLRDPDDWPKSLAGLEGLPYSMLAFNEQSDDPCPLGYADVLWPLQVERNKVRTILNEMTKRMRRLIVANANAFTDQDKAKIADSDLVEVLFAQGDVSQTVAQIPIAGFDQTLLLYDQMIVDDMRELLGQSRMARGQRINVNSATEAASVAQGDSVLSARNQGRVEEWLQDSIRLYAKVVQGSATDSYLVPVMGEEDASALMAGADAVLEISPEQIQGEFAYEIQVGSTLPKNDQAEKADALAFLQAIAPFAQNANIPEALIELVVAFNRDPRRALLNAMQIQKTNQLLPGQPPVEPPKGAGVDPAAMLMAGRQGMQ